ncbi:MAG TPA: long-chain fatty acid--CoA ligase [Gemmatimonadales bacterium]|nr:long-chain fatty acid--CoA ligase [Gemmatimonadales bacterium]
MAEPRTLTDLFFQAIERFGQRPVAMRSKLSGAWVDVSYAELLDKVRDFSFGLRELGIKPGGHVAILSENRPEWAIADYACLAAGAADVSIYPTLPSRQIEYILRDSESVAVCVSTPDQLKKIVDIRAGLPLLEHIIAFDARSTGHNVLSFESVLAKGKAAQSRYPKWKEEALAARPDDVATLIYTSGTTGDPKGVMLTHGNITSNVVSGLAVLQLRDTDQCLSFLPLSHIFERMGGHYCMMLSGVIINYALSIDTVSQDMIDRSPSVVLSVPRLYEKIYARVLENALAAGGIKKQIFFWAKHTAEAWADLALNNKEIPGGLAFKKRIADKLVFSKLQARTGGKLRFFVSGGAPLSAEIAKFFYAAGLPVLEGYGLTETSPVITVNTWGHIRLGTVGQPLPGVEVKIAPDGEILTRSPSVMKGYYKKPEATAEVLDPDGWFHTGDIGELDQENYLKITDRKKDLIVTAGGKKIAPQPIEGRVKANKFVANAVMLGDKRQYPIMLIVPNMDNLRDWARQRGVISVDDNSLLANPETVAKMEREMVKNLRDLARFEMPKKLLLIPRDFTIESGELTPTMKVKRRVVEKNYKDQIEALYAEPAGGSHDVT